ncbi:MAG: hypothetical protein ACR2H5_23095 [Ktedonobacteraceae bacterium]
MLNKLRGHNLAHPGCLVGTTTGLIIGILLAGIMASVYNVAFNTVLFTWLGITVVLAVLGWIIGDRLSTRFPALDEEPTDSQTLSTAQKPPLP